MQNTVFVSNEKTRITIRVFWISSGRSTTFMNFFYYLEQILLYNVNIKNLLHKKIKQLQLPCNWTSGAFYVQLIKASHRTLHQPLSNPLWEPSPSFEQKTHSMELSWNCAMAKRSIKYTQTLTLQVCVWAPLLLFCTFAMFPQVKSSWSHQGSDQVS